MFLREAGMTRVIAVEDAGLHLKEIIEGLDSSDDVTIVSGGEAIAVLRRPQRTSWPCQPGTAKDTKHWMAPDFNAPVESKRGG